MSAALYCMAVVAGVAGVIRGVDAAGIQAQLIVPTLAVCGKGHRQALGLAVASGKSKPTLTPPLPSFQQA
jgi:hypothetical protein